MLISQTRHTAWDRRLLLALASPLAVLVVGYLAARLFAAWLGQWAWVGVALIYWGSLIALVAAFGDLSQMRRWLGPSQGSRWWALLAVLVGLIAFPLLLFPNWQLLRSVPLAAAWLAFAVVNGFLEEVYWRGFLLDAAAPLPRAFSLTYSIVLFTVLHPLMWGVFSRLNAFDPANPLAFAPFGVILVGLSLAYAVIYLRTRSLRWAILSHCLSDLGNLSIFVFMNLITIK